MEISTEHNENIVNDVCDIVRTAQDSGKSVQPYQQTIYDIDYLLTETNSGASFEQYFRWASMDEIRRIVSALREVGLENIAQLTEKAIGCGSSVLMLTYL